MNNCGKRILYVIHSNTFGGPHNQALQLAAPLAAAGFEVSVLVPDEPGDAVTRLREAGIAVDQMRLTRPRAKMGLRGAIVLPFRMIAQVLRLARYFKAEMVDIVQIHGALNFDAAAAGRLAGRAVVWQFIDTRCPRPLIRLMKPLYSLADTVMSTGTAVGALHLGARAKSVHTFFPPVRAAFFTDAHVRSRPQIVEILCVGNFNPQKGQRTLVKAVGTLPEHIARQIKVTLIGGKAHGHDKYLNDLHADIEAARSVPIRIVESSAKSNVLDFVSRSHVLVVPSATRSEGIPTVLLEGMANGCLCVASDVGGVVEASGGRNQLVAVVPPDDPFALAGAIQMLIHESDFEKVSRASIDHASQTFAIDSCVATHVTAYQQALIGKPRRGAK